MLHRLAHLLGWNTGNPEVWTTRCGRRMVGFRCDKCHALKDIHPVPENLDKFTHLRRRL